MFELPEYITLARQLSETITGKMIEHGSLGNSPHKFVWYNRTPDEFRILTPGKMMGRTYTKGRWMFIPFDPGYVFVFGECGGKILYHDSASQIPKKYHLQLTFKDGSALSAMTQMWGAMELYKKGKELDREYIRDMRPTPVDAAFSYDYFKSLLNTCISDGKRSVKGLLTQDQLIPGLGNAIAQDIMFASKLHPRHPIGELNENQKRQLFNAIMGILSDAIEMGGRNDEYDLFGKPGGYKRIMDKNTTGHPCLVCNTEVQKIQYLGGACYFCPKCQV